MGFTAPLGLLALLGIPAVLILHLYRRRFRERQVAGLFLFAPDALPADAGRTRSRLLRTPSLWLELLAALLLALWLGGFHLGAPPARPHLVVVLDDSASMGARTSSQSVTEAARSWVEERIDELASDDVVVTLVTTGRRPQVLVGPRASRREALEALRAWRPTRPTHDPSTAWALAADLAGEGAELVFVTDHDEPTPPPDYRHLAFGVPHANAGLVGARRLRRGDETRIYADLMSWAEDERETEVVLEAVTEKGTREIARERVALPPARAVHLAWTVPAGEVALRVRLADDALAIDNEALLVPEPSRIVPVHVAMEDDDARRLRLARALDVIEDVHVIESAEGARLRIATAAGRVPPRGAELLVRAVGEARDDWIGPFLMERAHAPAHGEALPLLQGVNLEGVVWSAGRGALDGLPLVLAGEQVLLAETRVGGGRRLHMNLDPARSNLPSSPDWPILLANLAAQVRGELPGPVQANVRLGAELALRYEGSAADAAAHVLVGPEGHRRPARGVALLTWEALRPGLHVLHAGETPVARFAAHFVDPDEADLRAAAQRNEPPGTERGPARAGLDDTRGERERLWLALLLLAAIVADWFVLGRRR